MTDLVVNKLNFVFNPAIAATIYDQWQYHTAVRNAIPGGQKAIDIVAVDDILENTIWLIEAKDFRVITKPPRPSHIAELAPTVAAKVQDTLAGLAAASNQAPVATERQFAIAAMACIKRRIVLHLEPHTGTHTALFPTRFAADVFQKLRQLVKTIDANPLVLNIANTHLFGVPWTVT